MSNNIKDERIIAERRKIQSRGYYWIVIILMVSILVQQFVLDAPFSQYAVEFFLLMGCGLYNVVASYKKGLNIWNAKSDSKKRILLTAIVTGAFSVILFSILSGNNNISNLAIFFLSFVLFFFITQLVLVGMNRKKQERIDREIGDDAE